MVDDFDFGFTAVSEEELAAVQEASKLAKYSSESAESYKERLYSLHKMITPFLNNLKKNPEKSYIYWENRVPKIEEFQKKLDSLLD